MSHYDEDMFLMNVYIPLGNKLSITGITFRKWAGLYSYIVLVLINDSKIDSTKVLYDISSNKLLAWPLDFQNLNEFKLSIENIEYLILTSIKECGIVEDKNGNKICIHCSNNIMVCKCQKEK